MSNSTNDNDSDRLGTGGPRTAKGSAVAMWRDALEELPEGPEWAETLREAHIHDRRDRMDISEIIHNEDAIPKENYQALADAWSDLKSEFEEHWS